MQTLQHVDQTPAVLAEDKRLRPLRQRYDELLARVRHWKGLLNPHVDISGTERETLEAKIKLPGVEIELGEAMLEIGDLETKRAHVRRAEKERITHVLDGQRREIIARFAPVLQEAGSLTQELYDLEQSYETLGANPIVDFLFWPELMPTSSPTWTPRLPSRLQSWRENGWLT